MRLTQNEERTLISIARSMGAGGPAVVSVHALTGRNLRGKELAERNASTGVWSLTTKGERWAAENGWLQQRIPTPEPETKTIKTVLTAAPRPAGADRPAVQEMASGVDRVTRTSELDTLQSIRDQLADELQAVDRVIEILKRRGAA